MSRIDELIQQLCPDGVEYKPLGEIGTFVRGNGLQKKDFVDHGVGCIHYGQIYTYYKTFATETKSFVSEEKALKLKKAHPGDLIIATTSENTEDVCKAVAWLGKGDICISGDAYVYHHSQNPKYLAYIFQTQSFYDHKKKFATGTKVIRLSDSAMGKFQCPIPPLPVQEEIVRILDKFTALEAELEAELEARRKQYEFYRDQLLNFKGLMSRGAGSLVSLGDLFDFKNGLNKSKEFFGSGYPIVNFTDVFKKNHLYATDLKGRVQVTADEISRYSVQKGDVFFTRTSETREEIGMASVVLDDIGDCVFSGFVLRARPKTTLLLPQYCGFCFRHNDVRKQIIQRASFTTRALTSGTALAKIQIPVPPLTEQERIVAILDKFDALVNDISSGLPAELEMRRKQYEYYRDRLLTFKPLAKEA